METVIVWRNCEFRQIRHRSPASAALIDTEVPINMRVMECVFDNVVSEKEEGEIMTMHHSTLSITNSTFFSTIPSPVSSPRELQMNEGTLEQIPTERNGDCSEECSCSMNHSALLLKAVSVSIEDSTFVNMSNGALCVSDDSRMVLKSVRFTSQADDDIS